jgi:cell division protein FtsX
MATLREWVIRLWGTLRPSRRDADLEEELRLHLEMAADHERRRARSTEEAWRGGRDRFGGIAQGMEAVRDQRGLPWLSDLARDLCYGLRALRRNPMFASVAVLTLALGIGANTAIFTLADAPPHASRQQAARPRRASQRGPGGDIFPFTSAAAVDLAVSRDVLSGLAAFRPVLNTHISVNGETELALMQSVSGNYHAVLGIGAVVGRTLTEQDRDPVAVISHRYWQRRFAGDPNVVGRALEMQGRPFTIVGVTPPEFFGTQPGRYVDVTAPLAAHPVTMPPNARWLYLVGRLAPGVSREQARAALRVRWTQLAAPSSPSRPPVTLELDSGAQGLNELRREFSVPLRILMATVAVVLLVACANLAGLLIVRSSARQQETTIRLSLGAARGRIVRQLLTESALLAAAGGAAGVALAYWVTHLLVEALTPFLHAEVHAAAPALPPPSVVSLEDHVAAVLVEERMLAALSIAMAVLAAMLAAVGIYSTVASAVARRQREIGVRMALGALPGQVARMMVGEAFGIVAGGLALGGLAAFAAAVAARSFLAGVLFELSPTDPLIMVSSPAAILLIASLAAYVPARRAAHIDPVASLKYE